MKGCRKFYKLVFIKKNGPELAHVDTGIDTIASILAACQLRFSALLTLIGHIRICIELD